MTDFICDIDGTVANNDHRRAYVQSVPRNWAAYEARMEHDLPISPVIEILWALFAAGHNIIMCSARGEQSRQTTEEWLSRYNIRYHKLYMRAAGDYRNDSIIKGELLDQMLEDGYQPTAVFDDRPSVVEQWRERGLFVFNVGDGVPF